MLTENSSKLFFDVHPIQIVGDADFMQHSPISVAAVIVASMCQRSNT